MTKKVLEATCPYCTKSFVKEWRNHRYCGQQCAIKDNVEVDPKSGCWNWTRKPAATGYGVIQINGVFESAHRVSFSSFHDIPIPKGWEVRHECDNRLCANPEHLLIGTKFDNMRDMAERGRQPRTRLTAEQVRLMRDLKDSLMIRQIAAMFDYSPTAVHRILHKKSWVHLD